MVELIFQRPLADSRARGFAKSPQTGNQAILFDSRQQRESAGAAACAHRGKGRKGRTKEGEGRTNGGKKVGQRKGHEGKGGDK